MEYNVTIQDLEKCFKFAVEYHLDKTKLASNRTTGQYRGLGGIIDSFFIGKLIEIGVSKMIEAEAGKECVLDFDIHSINKDNVSDADIVKIKESGRERKPNFFVEIKNVSPDDRWIGLTAEQFSTILRNETAGSDPKKVFIIYASLLSKKGDKDGDILGVYLKSKTGINLFDQFSDTNDLYVKIQYIITGEDLKNKGTEFNQGSYLYETEVFEEAGGRSADQIMSGEYEHTFKKVNLEGNKLPIIMRDNMPEPKEYGEFTYEGDIEVCKKENRSSKRMYIYCKTDAVIKNKVLGTFKLEKGKLYECFFTTVGMNPSLKRNNIWIAQRNLPNILSITPQQMLKEIAEKI